MRVSLGVSTITEAGEGVVVFFFSGFHFSVEIALVDGLAKSVRVLSTWWGQPP